MFFFAVPHFSLHANFCKNCGAFCRLVMQSLKVPACCFLNFFSCCLSPLNSTDYCWSCVCVYACVCVLCFEAITVAACDVAVTRACVLVCVHFRPCCVVCLRCTVRMSAARNLSISPARYSGTSVLISGAGRFSVQPVCS